MLVVCYWGPWINYLHCEHHHHSLGSPLCQWVSTVSHTTASWSAGHLSATYADWTHNLALHLVHGKKQKTLILQNHIKQTDSERVTWLSSLAVGCCVFLFVQWCWCHQPSQTHLWEPKNAESSEKKGGEEEVVQHHSVNVLQSITDYFAAELTFAMLFCFVFSPNLQIFLTLFLQLSLITKKKTKKQLTYFEQTNPALSKISINVSMLTGAEVLHYLLHYQ